MARIAVVAVGGNSLIRDSKHQSVEDQYEVISETVTHLIPILNAGFRLVVTHGNGPQVGFILLRSYLAKSHIHEIPLYSGVADTQGALGFQFQQAFFNEFNRQHIEIDAATVVTQVVVDSNDPEFKSPSKPIGPFYTKEEAEQYAREAGWAVVEDAGRGYRRVVASPEPIAIMEQRIIKELLLAGHVVIAVGGGGIPVYKDDNGNLVGTMAVIDKDRASSLLAANLEAELFLISTAVEYVCLDFNTPKQRIIKQMTVAEARQGIKEGHFKKGSMLPKIEAAIKFLERGGKEVIITSPECIGDAIAGKTGTHIYP